MEESSVSEAVRLAWGTLLDKATTERVVDAFLRENPSLLGQCLNFHNFGHGGMWIIPQKLIDPGAIARKGLKPDYLFGGKSSDGIFWCVAELKGPGERLFNRYGTGKKSVRFSQAANEGICQLLQYMDYCSSQQSYLRDHLKLQEFREPKGFLIVGRESEFENDSELQDLKAAWNRISGGKIMLRTYDALLRSTAGSWASTEHFQALTGGP